MSRWSSTPLESTPMSRKPATPRQSMANFMESIGKPANSFLSAGDAVRHRSSGEVAVVVERVGRNRIKVSLDNRTDTIWYAHNVELV